MKKIIAKFHYKARSRWRSYFHQRKQRRTRGMILHHYQQHPPHDREIREAVNYLSGHPLTTFYGTFQEKYDAGEVDVFIDASNGLPYVLTEGKKLFFKRSINSLTVKLLYNALRVEQDSESPHCYTDLSFQINKDEILADVGCAEGYFSLLNIEKVQRTYLFEQDREWVEALEATFAPWKEKVVIIPSFVSDRNDGEHVSLDHYFLSVTEKPDFYKIDVEGAESSVLKGMNDLLASKPVKIALCTYHHQEDYNIFSRYFEEMGFSHRPTPGVMIYQNDLDDMTPPYFRKCMIKATNQHE